MNDANKSMGEKLETALNHVVDGDGMRTATPSLVPPVLPGQVPSTMMDGSIPSSRAGQAAQMAGPRRGWAPPIVPGLPEEAPSAATPVEAAAPRVVQLDQVMILRIELLSAKQQLAERDQQLAKIALQDVHAKKAVLQEEQQQLMAEVSQQIGTPVSGNIRLLDREKGLCQVGN